MENQRRNILFIIMVVYTLFLGYFLFFSNRTIDLSWIDNGGWKTLQAAMVNKVNFKPFATINNYLYKYSIGYVDTATVLRNIGGNIAVFMPFALFFPAIYRKMKHRARFYGFWFVTFVLIEVLQYLTMSGAMDVDDLILNLFGLFIVYECFGHRLKTGDS